MPASAKASSALTLTLQSDREIVLTRVFNAPRRLVFEALSQPEHLLQRFGPHRCPLVECQVDFRAGGSWRYILRGADGRKLGMKGVYQEIVPPERIVSTESFDDYPGESLNTVTLTEENGRTTLRVTVRYPSAESRDAVLRSGMEQGAGETYDRLAEHLATLSSVREMVMTRVFDAPRELVFKCWTDRDRLQRWWGPKGFTNPVCEVDVRPGGTIRIHMRAPDGVVYPMTGAFVEIVEPERLVFTSAALDENGEPMFEILNTVLFSEEGGKTKLTLHAIVLKAKPEAAPHLGGMEIGWGMSLDRLSAQLAGEEIV
jgi:uncharacterized protein YndB with AHSA1/START domain